MPPGKAEGGREKDICAMPEASLHPAALLSEAGMKRERRREARSAMGHAGVAARWLTQNVQVEPQNSSPGSGMGGAAVAAHFWASPFDLLALHPSTNSHSPSTRLAKCLCRI